MSHYPPTYVHWFPPKIRIDVNKPFKIKPSAPFSCSGKRSRNDLYDSIISINAVAGIASQFEPSFSPWPYSLFSPQNLAIELLLKSKKIKADVGKSPAGFAAAALYIASIMNGKKVTQKELAVAADVTEVTVRNRYKRVATDLGLRV
jgi:hypothetical protein